MGKLRQTWDVTYWSDAHDAAITEAEEMLEEMRDALGRADVELEANGYRETMWPRRHIRSVLGKYAKYNDSRGAAND